mmetsp:Transcript_48525/g.125913  ORF Transcript_48525/g.125913 Transcript_48525/m.125913 type:complete len:398 (-) Transcript_48525:342-1535(-)
MKAMSDEVRDRLMEETPFKGTYLWRGRALLGPSRKRMGVAMCLIFGCPALYLLETCHYLSEVESFAAVLFYPLLIAVILTYYFYFSAALSDPGLLRADPSLKEVELDTIPNMLYNDGESGGRGRKLCHKCRLYRPHRAAHCYECDGCIDEHDHHCPWIGTCVGKRNYRAFVAFLFFVSSLGVILTTATFTALGDLVLFPSAGRGEGGREGGEGEGVMNATSTVVEGQSVLAFVTNSAMSMVGTAVRRLPLTVVSLLVTPLCAMSVLALLAFHILMISAGRTTREQLTGNFQSVPASFPVWPPSSRPTLTEEEIAARREERRRKAAIIRRKQLRTVFSLLCPLVYLFDREFRQNWWRFFCDPIPPSRVREVWKEIEREGEVMERGGGKRGIEHHHSHL